MSLSKNKLILIAVLGIVGLLIAYKLISDIMVSTGLVKDAHKENGELKIINKNLVNANKENKKTIKVITKTNDITVKKTIKTIKEINVVDVSTTKKITNIKKRIEKVKQTIKIKPKPITNNVIKVNREEYIETGKVLIDGLYKEYQDVKDLK